MSGRTAQVTLNTDTLRKGRGFVHQSPVPGESLTLECIDEVDDGATVLYVCRVMFRIRKNPTDIVLPSGNNITDFTIENN